MLMTEIEVNGLQKIQRELPEFRENYTTIFLDIPKQTLIERNLERNPDTPKDELDKRIQSLEIEKEKA